jgi:carboxypeptidase family protein
VQVNATGPSSASGTTDANGCFVFTGMTPGNYNVGVAATGYVDKDGNVRLQASALRSPPPG